MTSSAVQRIVAGLGSGTLLRKSEDERMASSVGLCNRCTETPSDRDCNNSLAIAELGAFIGAQISSSTLKICGQLSCACTVCQMLLAVVAHFDLNAATHARPREQHKAMADPAGDSDVLPAQDKVKFTEAAAKLCLPLPVQVCTNLAATCLLTGVQRVGQVGALMLRQSLRLCAACVCNSVLNCQMAQWTLAVCLARLLGAALRMGCSLALRHQQGYIPWKPDFANLWRSIGRMLSWNWSEQRLLPIRNIAAKSNAVEPCEVELNSSQAQDLARPEPHGG